jgi:hypothetical protein
MIIIDEAPAEPPPKPLEEEPKEIVIEAVDFEEAGEARDATFENGAASAVDVIAVSHPEITAEPPQPRGGDFPQPPPGGDFPQPPPGGDFEEESKTRPFGVRLPEAKAEEVPDFVAAGPLLGPSAAEPDSSEGEATQPGPLRTRRPSG